MKRPPGGKKCWGEYGDRFAPEERNPEQFFACPVAEHCFRVTVVDAVVSTASYISLIVVNHLVRGEIKAGGEQRHQEEDR